MIPIPEGVESSEEEPSDDIAAFEGSTGSGGATMIDLKHTYTTFRELGEQLRQVDKH